MDGINTNTCGVKTCEICRNSLVAYASLNLFSYESGRCYCLQRRSLGKHGCSCCVAIIGSSCFSSSFLAISTRLSFLVCKRSETIQILHGVPAKDKEVGPSPHYFFPSEAKSFYLENSICALSNAGLGDGMRQAK